ncbi:MAG: L,D-transpeptidase family protein [Vulcanimicrobiota bacterium]
MRRGISLLLLLLCTWPGWADVNGTTDRIVLECEVIGPRQVKASWRVRTTQPTQVRILRTPAPIDCKNLWQWRYPVLELPPPPGTEGVYVDGTLAEGTTYYYWVQAELDGVMHYSKRAKVTLPNHRLPRLSRPSFLIDKLNYYLEVRDGSAAVKRYPVSFGRDPLTRKLHQDNSTTPEGTYQICGLQDPATYYRAFDLDYPNAFDKIRYRFAKKAGLLPRRDPEIGGAIQIHGDIKDRVEVFSNWTEGCIAMRNDDLDELFADPSICEGVYVFIVGENLTREDLASILKPWSREDMLFVERKLQWLGFPPGEVDGELDEATMEALGWFQLRNRLPLTCELDTRTVKLLWTDPPTGGR